MITLTCPFCHRSELPRLTPEAKTCRVCRATYLLAPNVETGRAALATHLGLALKVLMIVSIPISPTKGVCCVGWNPNEILNPHEVAEITGKDVKTVLQHLREHRFMGAYQEADGRREWYVPRKAILNYLYTRRTYNLTAEGRARRGRPAKTKNI